MLYFDAVIRSTLVMTAVIAVSHVLINSMIEDNDSNLSRRAPGVPSVVVAKQQKQEELLKFVMGEMPADDPKPPAVQPQVDDFAQHRHPGNNKERGSEVDDKPRDPAPGILAFNDFPDFLAGQFSSINFTC